MEGPVRGWVGGGGVESRGLTFAGLELQLLKRGG